MNFNKPRKGRPSWQKLISSITKEMIDVYRIHSIPYPSFRELVCEVKQCLESLTLYLKNINVEELDTAFYISLRENSPSQNTSNIFLCWYSDKNSCQTNFVEYLHEIILKMYKKRFDKISEPSLVIESCDISNFKVIIDGKECNIIEGYLPEYTYKFILSENKLEYAIEIKLINFLSDRMIPLLYKQVRSKNKLEFISPTSPCNKTIKKHVKELHDLLCVPSDTIESLLSDWINKVKSQDSRTEVQCAYENFYQYCLQHLIYYPFKKWTINKFTIRLKSYGVYQKRSHRHKYYVGICLS
ncbi:hypothetical protein [Zophobihabitans entericus]|uniref:Uncharacterized protein n=1 Tax=Zophobihabitans entericus TaxID=1635327 RepID=A0A6G9I9T6_9GAMM|nr:hypothetical protein [Zophobihabitans entericus]QIQ20998.1 hypothetical protein IPMB12_04470 [Zophobihabitans entericus]